MKYGFINWFGFDEIIDENDFDARRIDYAFRVKRKKFLDVVYRILVLISPLMWVTFSISAIGYSLEKIADWFLEIDLYFRRFIGMSQFRKWLDSEYWFVQDGDWKIDRDEKKFNKGDKINENV